VHALFSSEASTRQGGECSWMRSVLRVCAYVDPSSLSARVGLRQVVSSLLTYVECGKNGVNTQRGEFSNRMNKPPASSVHHSLGMS
jgi:hypothetical protein